MTQELKNNILYTNESHVCWMDVKTQKHD